MTIQDMHYDFKQKLNVIDSQKYRNLKVPEIDWKLNEAHELFVKMVAQPRIQRQLGFEMNQRTIDDIKSLVVDQKEADGQTISVYDAANKSYLASLPSDYMFYSKSRCLADKGECKKVSLKVAVIQHDDESETSFFDKSSFEWRHINAQFNKEGIVLFTDSTFIPTKLLMSYIKNPRMVHNAQDWDGGTYNTLEGVVLTGRVDSDLPPITHREIVDLAVFITAGDLNLSSYGIKQNKIKLVN